MKLKNNSESFNKKLRIFNHILSIIVIIFALYLVFYPFFPSITSKISRYQDKTKGYKYQSVLASSNIKKADIKTSELKKIPTQNTLVIPQIGVDTEILEGKSINTLKKGIWRRPQTSTPDKGGNTVIVGHRRMYTSGSNTFYHLNELKVGDQFLLFWQGKEYDYEIIEIKEITPNHIEIENNTTEPILTLYTCTPLLTATKRLVIIAKLIEL